jgi:hypothetical protein
VRSAHSQVVNGRGWRWGSLLRLGPMPWGPRFWALPGVPGLALSERYPRDRGQQHQKLPAGARQRRLGIRRWGARASPGARPRAPLRRHNRAVAAASVGASPRWHHPCAGGCRPLCTGPTPPATAAWPAAPHWRAAADTGPSAAAAGPRLYHGDGTRLVGRRGAGGGDRRGYGGLVARRHAPPADPLGPRPRSARAVRAPSPAVHRSEGRARPAAGVVGAALAPGSALTGGAGSSGPGDATAMARVGHGSPPPSLWGCARGSRCGPDRWRRRTRGRSGRRCCSAPPSPPLRLRAPWGASRGGPRPMLTCHR